MTNVATKHTACTSCSGRRRQIDRSHWWSRHLLSQLSVTLDWAPIALGDCHTCCVAGGAREPLAALAALTRAPNGAAGSFNTSRRARAATGALIITCGE